MARLPAIVSVPRIDLLRQTKSICDIFKDEFAEEVLKFEEVFVLVLSNVDLRSGSDKV